MSLVAGGNEVVRDEFERWAEDLDENFRRVLLENLSRELGSSNVSTIHAVATQPGSHMLRVEILKFDADTDGIARLRVRWSLTTEASPNQFVISEWSEQIQNDSTEARVRALSSLAASLSREIARQVKKPAATAQKP
jgi:uncharacterized lipoprotein YmbA